jgi:phosphoribosylamine--glycine ligase
MDFERLTLFAAEEKIDLTVVGPEAPLASGIVDAFRSAGLRAFGPTADAARLESSKAFAKGIMERHGIPTAAYAEFDDPKAAREYVQAQGAPIVVKADGLAAGKGVTVAQDVESALAAIDAAMTKGAFGDAGRRVIVEEYLEGEEASIFALSDGKDILVLDSSQDHKAAYDGDEGPNTGGMGAYSPAPVVTEAVMAEVSERVLRPCIEGMAREGCPYTGVLYAGLMITDAGPKVIEFNCRFGDPETQVVLPRLRGDFAGMLMACCDGGIEQSSAEWAEGACVTVVMASGGYPGSYEKGRAINGIEDAERDTDVMVFHAGTKEADGTLVTNGGRVLNVTARAGDIESAITKAYEAVAKITFEGAMFRRDIGQKALARLSR